MIEWITEPLSSVCASIDYGFTASASTEATGPKFLRITDIVSGAVDWKTVPHVVANMETAEKYRLHHGDIVIARTGASTGSSLFVGHPPPAVFASYLVRLQINRKNDPRFVAYWLKSEQFSNFLNGVLGDKSAQPNASASTMTSALMTRPRCRAVQEQIASVLASLDDKIELNRRMNETLEAMARAIFKDWFVDFGPTRAKMEGRSPYLAPDLWSLFPDKLNDEGKPLGWEMAKLGAVTSELRRGVSPNYTSVGGIMVLNQKCIRNRAVDTTFARLHDSTRRDVSDRMIQSGDILVNSTGMGTLGRVAQLWKLQNPMIVDSHVTVIRPNSAMVSCSFLGVALTERETEIAALGEGSTGQTELSRTRLAGMDVLVPSMTVQAAFDSLAVPIFDRSEANRSESRILATTRDALLPKLMSGEVRVDEVGEAV